MTHLRVLCLRVLCLGLFTIALTSSTPIHRPWSDISLPASKRAALLLEQMHLDEKLAMLHGPPSVDGSNYTKWQCSNDATCVYVGNVVSNERLGIPPLNMNDGPQGFRACTTREQCLKPGTTTSWPSGLTMAATWDEKAVESWGAGMGREFKAKGSNVQLGPGLCIARVPRNGRNFEYLSGEDPYLGYRLVQPAIRGIQAQGVVANAKHWVLNNQETNRFNVSAVASTRTRFELYYPPFEGAIEAGVGSFMCSYNRVDDRWSCENPETLKDLKEKLGFKGWVMSDWNATHSMSIPHGLDQEMPGSQYVNTPALTAALKSGSLTTARVNDAVYRMLLPMFQVGVMDAHPSTWNYTLHYHKNVSSDAAVQTARALSEASHVLVKNDNQTLPLPKNGKKIALLGRIDSGLENQAIAGGGGSGFVAPSYLVTPLMGFQSRLSDEDLDWYNGTDIDEAVKVAKAADYAVVFVGTHSAEGFDRPSLSLDVIANFTSGKWVNTTQNELVAAVAAVNPRTVVVVAAPGAVLLPWKEAVSSVVVNFMPGQEVGNAAANILFGDVNPSGKLPITLPNAENETDLTPQQWPGTPQTLPETWNANPPRKGVATYSEELLVGYRYYDHHKIDFTTGTPFGHGLSYTEFMYKDLDATDGGTISFTLSNVGMVAGAEVAQLYLQFPAAAEEPPRQLRGFQKVMLAAGETQEVRFYLRERDLSIWDTASQAWSPVKGTFGALVGSSSRDIRLTGNFMV